MKLTKNNQQKINNKINTNHKNKDEIGYKKTNGKTPLKFSKEKREKGRKFTRARMFSFMNTHLMIND